MPVEARLERLTGDEAANVRNKRLTLEVRDRAGLRCGNVGGVADHKDVRGRFGLQGVLVSGNEVQLVAQTRRPTNIGGTGVQRHDDSEVEGNFTSVVSDQL